MHRFAATAFALALALGTFADSATSAITTKPSNTSRPTVAGDASVGQILTVSTGTWSGSTPITYSYQWKRCSASGGSCGNISGATASSYKLVSRDQGRTVRAAVTAKNNVGTATVSSNLSPVVAAAPADTTAPTAPSALSISNVGQTSLTLSWAAAADDVGVAGYRLYRNGALVATATSLSFQHSGLACGTSYTLAVEAFDAAGNTSARAATSAATAACSSTTSEYFRTLPVGSLLPRSDADCASRVARSPWEPRPENELANHTVPSGAVAWNDDPGWTYWRAFMAKRGEVTGNFSGTTDEVLQWAACKWGLDEDLLRAVAVQESSWREGFKGDYENGRYHSFGLMQIRHDDAAGRLVKGGYPATLESTALNVDYFGAEMRACFEGDFFDGGPWLYGGTRVQGDLWGCVGYWYSGNWYTSAAKDYIARVRSHYDSKPWVAWGYPGKS
jgi:autotransporter family porin